jgi:tetratricopeptide (TPR) repeat protein
LIEAAAGDLPPFLVIESEDDLILALPWELIRLEGTYVVHSGRLDVGRCVPVSGQPPVLSPPSDTVKLLVNVSAPIGAPPLNYEAESYLITRALQHQVDILVNEMGEVQDLIDGLKIPPPALGVHFSGHGGPATLVFENEFGEEDIVSVHDLLTRIRQQVGERPRFFYLACCHGGDAPSLLQQRAGKIEQSGIAATATELHREGVTQVVGYFGPVYDRLSTWAETAFYREIARGRRTRDALRVARIEMIPPLGEDIRRALRDAVAFEGRGTVPYGWAQLLLYHRGPDFPLGRPRTDTWTAASDTTLRHLREAYPGSRTEVLTEGFVGRRQELHGLRHSIKAGQNVHVVQGLGGLGKSAFCNEALRLYDRLGWQRMALWCADVEGSPEPVGELLRQFEEAGESLIGDEWTAVVAHFDQLAARQPELQQPALRLVNLIAFMTRQEGPPIVLYLDNLESLLRGPDDDNPAATSEWRDDHCRVLWLSLQKLAEDQPDRFALLASCRYRRSDFGGTLVPFGPLPADAVWRLMGWYPTLRRFSIPTRSKLLQHLSGHARSVEFLDRLLAETVSCWEFDNAPLETAREASEGPDAWAEREWEEIVAPALAGLDQQLSENLLFERLWQLLDVAARDLMVRATVLRRPAEREVVEALHVGPDQAKVGVNRLRNLSLLTEIEERRGSSSLRLFEVHPSLARLVRGLLWEEDAERLREDGHRRAGDFLEGKARTLTNWQDNLEAAYHLDAIGQADRAFTLLYPLFERLQQQGRFLDGLAVLDVLTTTSRLSDRFRAMLPGYAADVAIGLGDLTQAASLLDDAIGIQQQLVARDPSNAQWQRDLSVSLKKLGHVRLAQRNLEAALDAYNQSLQIAQQLAAHDPSDAQLQRDLSVSLHKIGGILSDLGDLQQALEVYNQDLQIAQQLAARNPSNAEWQSDLSVSYEKIGGVRRAQGNLEAALEAYNQSLAIREQLAAQDPSNTQWQRGLAISFLSLFEALPEDRRSEAVELRQRAFTILVELAQAGRLSPPDLALLEHVRKRLGKPGD